MRNGEVEVTPVHKRGQSHCSVSFIPQIRTGVAEISVVRFRNVVEIYPDGFLPSIQTDITDMSLLLVLRAMAMCGITTCP